MTRFFLGGDVGSSKTHLLVADEQGRALGFGRAGAGNHEVVGYDGLRATLREAAGRALNMAGLSEEQIAGAGFGVAGLDWSSEVEPTLDAISVLGMHAPVEAINDALIGLLAGSSEGWGVAVVSGTGCNCWGRDRTHRRRGQVTGAGLRMGEAAGAGELVAMAMRMVAYEWSRRGATTQLTPAFVEYFGARDVDDLIQSMTAERIYPSATAAPVVFEVAAAGDAVALNVIEWAGRELGELACAVIRQLEFEGLAFDVVMTGSLFNGRPPLADPMRETIHKVAPGARIVPLETLPVVGAVLLGMEQAQLDTTAVRATLIESTNQLIGALASEMA
jgi:N-acetylglucosamine kinase-like BadF-type ATPase